MGYIFSVSAIIADLIGATLLKFFEGFYKLFPIDLCIIAKNPFDIKQSTTFNE